MTDLDPDIIKKYDLRTAKGKADAEREQKARNTGIIGKFFGLVWFVIKVAIFLAILGGIVTFIETGSL